MVLHFTFKYIILQKPKSENMKKSIFTFCLLAISCIVFAQNNRVHPTSPPDIKAILEDNYDFRVSIFHAMSESSCVLSFSYETMILSIHEIELDIKKHHMKLNKEQADALFSLFTAAICSAGIEKKDNDNILEPTDQNPIFVEVSRYCGIFFDITSKGSNCDRLKDVIYTLIQCVKENQPIAIDKEMKEIKALTQEFIKLYEENPQGKKEILDLHQKYKVKGPSMGLNY